MAIPTQAMDWSTAQCPPIARISVNAINSLPKLVLTDASKSLQTSEQSQMRSGFAPTRSVSTLEGVGVFTTHTRPQTPDRLKAGHRTGQPLTMGC